MTVGDAVVTGGDSKCGLILQQTLFEQLLCQEYNRRATSVSVHSAAKQIHIVLIKKSFPSQHPPQNCKSNLLHIGYLLFLMHM